VGDIFSALPGITGKIELEYEGELRGSEVVMREIIRQAVASIYDSYFAGADTQQIEQWFNLGGSIKVEDDQSAAAMLTELKQIQGLIEKLSALGIASKDSPERIVSAAEFLLEGMVAHRRIGRSEERGFVAPEKVTGRRDRGERGERNFNERDDPEEWPPRRPRKVYN
jgi:magnesium chelatase subunit I